MADSQLLTVIRIWAAMAWADGVIAAAEKSALERLIKTAGLGEEDLATARGWLDTRVELDETGLAELSDGARAGIYQSACRIAALDREVADSERTMLVKLRDALKLKVDAAREIEAGIPGVTIS